MNWSPRLMSRIALFAALFYVLSWGTAFLPNVNLGFLVAFSAGFLWGAVPGLLVGAVGMGLFTTFNPYGPATLPVAAAQIAGMSLCGLLGYVFRGLVISDKHPDRFAWWWLGVAGFCCALVFYLPVSVVDAWVFQPFWPRLIGGVPLVGVSIVANVVLFPLLFGVTRYLYSKEHVIR